MWVIYIRKLIEPFEESKEQENYSTKPSCFFHKKVHGVSRLSRGIPACHRLSPPALDVFRGMSFGGCFSWWPQRILLGIPKPKSPNQNTLLEYFLFYAILYINRTRVLYIEIPSILEEESRC
jgi:hypothetical protein